MGVEMNSVRLTTTSGHTWTTSVSNETTEATANDYFLNQRFDIGLYPVEKMEMVVKVEYFPSTLKENK